MDQIEDVSRGDVTCGKKNSDKVDKELPGRTEMVVVESISNELEGGHKVL